MRAPSPQPHEPPRPAATTRTGPTVQEPAAARRGSPRRGRCTRRRPGALAPAQRRRASRGACTRTRNTPVFPHARHGGARQHNTLLTKITTTRHNKTHETHVGNKAAGDIGDSGRTDAAPRSARLPLPSTVPPSTYAPPPACTEARASLAARNAGAAAALAASPAAANGVPADDAAEDSGAQNHASRACDRAIAGAPRRPLSTGRSSGDAGSRRTAAPNANDCAHAPAPLSSARNSCNQSLGRRARGVRTPIRARACSSPGSGGAYDGTQHQDMSATRPVRAGAGRERDAEKRRPRASNENTNPRMHIGTIATVT